MNDNLEQMFIDSIETFVAMQDLGKNSEVYWEDDFGNVKCIDIEKEWELQKEQAIEKIANLIKGL